MNLRPSSVIAPILCQNKNNLNSKSIKIQYIVNYFFIILLQGRRYQLQPTFESCTLFFEKFTLEPFKHPFFKEFSVPCTLMSVFRKPDLQVFTIYSDIFIKCRIFQIEPVLFEQCDRGSLVRAEVGAESVASEGEKVTRPLVSIYS